MDCPCLFSLKTFHRFQGNCCCEFPPNGKKKHKSAVSFIHRKLSECRLHNSASPNPGGQMARSAAQNHLLNVFLSQ